MVKKGFIQNTQKELCNYESHPTQVTTTPTNPNRGRGLSVCPFLSGLRPNPSVGVPYTVADRGGFYRVWQRTVPVANSLSGQISPQLESYTELGDGIYYWDNGWVESQDLVELTPSGAEAVHGQMKASFNSDITSVGAITLTTPAGELFQSHPLGLFYLARHQARWRGTSGGNPTCTDQNLNQGYGTFSEYVHFCADDYTWVSADSNFFYFAWCDRTRTFGTPPNSRPDADVKFAKTKQ